MSQGRHRYRCSRIGLPLLLADDLGGGLGWVLFLCSRLARSGRRAARKANRPTASGSLVDGLLFLVSPLQRSRAELRACDLLTEALMRYPS